MRNGEVMATNLSIENLAGSIKSGDVEGFLQGSKVDRPIAPSIQSELVEARISRDMEKEGLKPTQSVSGDKSVTFGQMLDQSLDQVNQHQKEADRAIKELVAGRNKNVHETMLTLERADASLKMMMQVRNKVLEAYKEIMRMQV